MTADVPKHEAHDIPSQKSGSPETTRRTNHTRESHYTKVPAIPAVCIVEIKPQNNAEGASLAMVLAREGARADSTPIWIPRDPNTYEDKDALVHGPRTRCTSNHYPNSRIHKGRSSQ